MNMRFQDRFSGWGYVILDPGQLPEVAETTFPEVWHHTYFKHEFHRSDPVFEFAKMVGRRSTAKLLAPSEMQSELFEEARLFGADSNVVCVSHFGGNRMILGAVNHDMDERALDGCLQDAKKQHRLDLMQRLEGLSDGQADVLDLCEEGLKDKEIACELGVSLSAIAQRKKAACERIGLASFQALLQLYTVAKWSGLTAKA